jgi:prolyl-tRNA synthetase
MIAGFIRLQSVNKNGKKTVSVRATEDAAGGTETITFEIIDQTKTVQVKFDPNATQTVSVDHTASGEGLVTVTAANSPQTIQRVMDVDKPSDP